MALQEIAANALNKLVEEGFTFAVATPRTRARLDEAIEDADGAFPVWASILQDLQRWQTETDREKSPASIALECSVQCMALVAPDDHPAEGVNQLVGLVATFAIAAGAAARAVKEADMSATLEEAISSALKANSSKGGTNAARAKEWWHQLAIDRCNKKRALDPDIYTTDLGDLLFEELGRAYPSGFQDPTKKVCPLPPSSRAYQDHIRAWEREGKVTPKRTTPRGSATA